MFSLICPAFLTKATVWRNVIPVSRSKTVLVEHVQNAGCCKARHVQGVAKRDTCMVLQSATRAGCCKVQHVHGVAKCDTYATPPPTRGVCWLLLLRPSYRGWGPTWVAGIPRITELPPENIKDYKVSGFISAASWLCIYCKNIGWSSLFRITYRFPVVFLTEDVL